MKLCIFLVIFLLSSALGGTYQTSKEEIDFIQNSDNNRGKFTFIIPWVEKMLHLDQPHPLTLSNPGGPFLAYPFVN